MKVVSKGEPVSAAEALMCVRKRLAQYRNSVKTTPVVDEEPQIDVPMAPEGEGDGDTDTRTNNTTQIRTTDQEEWERRMRKLKGFSLTQESLSESQGNHVRFLESVECYLASTVDPL